MICYKLKWWQNDIVLKCQRDNDIFRGDNTVKSNVHMPHIYPYIHPYISIYAPYISQIGSTAVYRSHWLSYYVIYHTVIQAHTGPYISQVRLHADMSDLFIVQNYDMSVRVSLDQVELSALLHIYVFYDKL